PITAPAAGTYYARVSGDAGLAYTLLVLRNATLDKEPNNFVSTPQSLGSRTNVLGAIAATGSGTGSAVVPSSQTSTEGSGHNIIPFSSATNRRYQQIYAASEFNSRGVIDAIRCRRDSAQAPVATTGLNVQISLAYAATTVATASATFANNIGSGEVTVYNGPLTLTSSGSGTPNPFEMLIDVDNLF